jgi:hypothetical protein
VECRHGLVADNILKSLLRALPRKIDARAMPMTLKSPDYSADFLERSNYRCQQLMIFRDGILVFSQPGALPAPALDDLISQVLALDMDAIRKEIAGS